MFERAELAERRSMMRRVRGAIETFVPVDIVIADVAEISADRDAVGSAVYWPLREGQTVFRRVDAHGGCRPRARGTQLTRYLAGS